MQRESEENSVFGDQPWSEEGDTRVADPRSSDVRNALEAKPTLSSIPCKPPWWIHLTLPSTVVSDKRGNTN